MISIGYGEKGFEKGGMAVFHWGSDDMI